MDIAPTQQYMIETQATADHESAVHSRLTVYKWLGTALGILGPLWVALGIPSSGCGFILSLASTVCWGYAGWRMKEPSLVSLNVVWAIINTIGIIRYGAF